jgi:hypothetical protein
MSPGTADPAVMRAALVERLSPMVPPRWWVVHAALTVTANSTPRPAVPEYREGDVTAPRPTRSKNSWPGIYAQVLGLERVGVTCFSTWVGIHLRDGP